MISVKNQSVPVIPHKLAYVQMAENQKYPAPEADKPGKPVTAVQNQQFC